MYKRIKQDVAKLISDAIGVSQDEALRSLETPKGGFGDLSSRISFDLAKKWGRSPVEITKEIYGKIGKHPHIERIATSGPYLNFFFSGAFFAEALEKAAKEPEYGKGDAKEGKVIIEFPSVNPNKPWHIGHLRNALLGDSVARILAFNGNAIEAMDYIDDLGLQAAQSLYGFLRDGKTPIGKLDHWVGMQYVEIAAEMESNPDAKAKVEELLKKVEAGDAEIAEKARKLSEDVVRAQYETDFALGIYHDALVFESDIIRTVFSEGLGKLKENNAIVLIKEGKNAGCWVVQLGEKYKNMKDDQKILIRSNGTATYTGKDIIFQMWKLGLLQSKFNYVKFIDQPNGKPAYMTSKEGEAMDFGSGSRAINIIGVEQSYPQEVIKDTLRIIGYGKQASGMVHLAYEHAVLPEGKFSGREGTWMGNTVDEFIEEANDRAEGKITKEMDDDRKKEIAKKVALAAIKFSFLRTSPEKKIVFDWDRALSFEGDSGPYLQYAYVRTLGILRKWGGNVSELAASPAFNADEKEVLGIMLAFRETVEKAAADLRPHYIADYAIDLATAFSRFYTKNQVLNADSEENKINRLMIVSATMNTLRNTLNLMGIEAPEEM